MLSYGRAIRRSAVGTWVRRRFGLRIGDLARRGNSWPAVYIRRRIRIRITGVRRSSRHRNKKPTRRCNQPVVDAADSFLEFLGTDTARHAQRLPLQVAPGAGGCALPVRFTLSDKPSCYGHLVSQHRRHRGLRLIEHTSTRDQRRLSWEWGSESFGAVGCVERGHGLE